MAALLIGKLIVRDWDWYREYRATTEPLVAEYGGRYLVKGGAPERLEGRDPPGDASVVIEFPDREAVRRWFDDPRYEVMKQLRRDNGVQTELIVVDAVPE
jgi:uncharacterized protein (DUF1330 family)